MPIHWLYRSHNCSFVKWIYSDISFCSVVISFFFFSFVIAYEQKIVAANFMEVSFLSCLIHKEHFISGKN